MRVLLHDIITGNEDWLMSRVIVHAGKHNFTKYTSTLAEAWRLSIHGLSEALLKAVADQKEIELGPDDDYRSDPVAAFGMLEARRHRARGITLGMFLGLMKYYRQSYLELLQEQLPAQPEDEKLRKFVNRFFDRVEIAFTLEWAGFSQEAYIDELKKSNRSMTNEKNQYLTIFESLANPVIFLNPDSRIVNVNHAASELLYGISTPGRLYYNEHYLSDVMPWLHEELRSFLAKIESEWEFEKKLTIDKTTRDFQIKFKRMLDVSNKFGGTAVILNDITDLRAAEQKISNMAYYDYLTGLPNSSLLEDRFFQAKALSDRNRRLCALFKLDIDKFKHVNDTLGHYRGDILLKSISDRLVRNLRKSDTVARLGEDEFVILLTDIMESMLVKETADKILGLFAEPFTLDDQEIIISSSIGIAVYPHQGSDLETLLKHADEAMNHVKGAGRNGAAFFQEESTGTHQIM